MAQLWQNAPAMWLEEGNYKGICSVAEAATHGNVGVGAFEGLTGEMVAVDGEFYRMSHDAKAHRAGNDQGLAFCMISEIAQRREISMTPGTSHEKMHALLDETLEDASAYYLLRAEGVFTGLQTRCFPEPSLPYRPFAEMIANQPEFQYDEIEGTVVGFRAPPYVGHIAPAGDHLHFLSKDKTVGGHVLDFVAIDGLLVVDRVDGQFIGYPKPS